MIADEAIETALRKLVDGGAMAGAATLVWRNGKIAQTTAVGWRNIEARQPLERDNLFRIASMTKPITSVAALMLYEEGSFALTDPIDRWAPELSKLRVLRQANGPIDDTVPAERPITFGDLLTHRSGLTYGSFHSPHPISRACQSLGDDIDSKLSPDEWIATLGSLPLIDQPGAAFHYGHSSDLLGFLIARIEDAPLGDVLERRIFKPLGMRGTGFTIAASKADRCAGLYGFDDAGRLTPRPFPARTAQLSYVSGGQGLWSTLDDYLAFARMFLGKGTVEGVRLLKPETHALMTSNQLTAHQRSTSELWGLPFFVAGHGFGMGLAVVMEPDKAAPQICGGGIGSVGWPGGFGGWWQADPGDASVLIFLAHNRVDLEQLEKGVGFGVHRAISKFHALATGATA